MSTFVWQDMPAMVAFRDASILDRGGAGIPPSEFLWLLADLDEEPDTAAFRWGLMISDSHFVCPWNMSFLALEGFLI
jgi:hypothetical protein